MNPEKHDRVRWPGQDSFVEVRGAIEDGDDITIFYRDGDMPGEVTVPAAVVERLAVDGAADSANVLAGLWAAWMASATTNSKSAALASSSLKPYPHQHYAVYGTMLPQPQLRFLLADEPGTGKTIMGGLYSREAERLGEVERCLVVCPAHLVSKWRADFDRFFGGGLHRIDNQTVKDGHLANGLKAGRGFWVVSLELASVNGAVQDAIHPDSAGWDLVIVDEAHRMTPTAESYFAVGRILKDVPRFLAMTATPHRGNEEYFRALMHLVDPVVFDMPAPGDSGYGQLTPTEMHLLRRMKEELTGYDGRELLFKERVAENLKVPLSSASEQIIYNDALDLVDEFFPDNARTLGRMVYGKRAASSLHSLAETLERRAELMGTKTVTEARRDPHLGDPDGGDEAAADHAAVLFEKSKDPQGERTAIKSLLAQIATFLDDAPAEKQASKWTPMLDTCLLANGITPGSDGQAVIFTEYADTAEWLVGLYRSVGYTAERYSGRDKHTARDEVRDRFMAGDFQVIVSTDAGNEGIDLQSAHVLVNWDIPWSLVTLEQRMGRIHRVGQNRTVLLYNIIATGTLEGDTYARLLDRLVAAANEMGGKMFDSLSLVGQKLITDNLGDEPPDVIFSTQPAAGMFDPHQQATVKAAIDKITDEQVRIAAQTAQAASGHLHTTFDAAALQTAVKNIHESELERINPHIVERYLRRLEGAGLVDLQPSAHGSEGSGLFNLAGSGSFSLPAAFGKMFPALVSTFGDSKAAAVAGGQTAASAAIDLGPATAPFRDLITAARDTLAPDLHRGGILQDETTITDYTLFLYETPATIGNRSVVWRDLIRVDDGSHNARKVAFELLANLRALPGETGKTPHPASAHNADEAIRQTVDDTAATRQAELEAWRKNAQKQLTRLEQKTVSAITDPEERSATRARLRAATRSRLARLTDASQVTAGEPQLVGWARVNGASLPENPDEKDSELIATKHVENLLSPAWDLDDVHLDNLGYDLHARRPHAHRAIEIKGIWGSAASEGIRLTGNEITRAALLGDDYWLYVVDQCDDGTGTLFCAIQNPAKVFDGLTDDVPVLKINGSALKANQTTENAK